MKLRLICVAAFLTIVLVFGITFFRFSLRFYEHQYLVTRKADGVVVLTGGRGRLSEGLRIFRESGASFLFISGVGKVNHVESIFSEEVLAGIDRNRIIMERGSKSTHENALFARDYMIERSVRSIILVTSSYHMQRALYIFQKVFPDNIDMVPFAVSSENFNLESWWMHPSSLKLALLEYFKYGWYRLRL